MVHALEEIRRVLIPGGLLLDVRPVADRWPVEVVSAGEVYQAGRLVDLPAQLDDDAASADAFSKAVQLGWFEIVAENSFDFIFSWDSPQEMQAYIAEFWQDYIFLPPEVLAQAIDLWARSPADSQSCVRRRIFIVKWRKTCLGKSL